MSEDKVSQSVNSDQINGNKEDILKKIQQTLQNVENKIDSQNEKINVLENKISALENYESKPVETEPPAPLPPEPLEKVTTAHEVVGETMEKLSGINKFIAGKGSKEAMVIDPIPEEEAEVAVPPPSKKEIAEVTASLEEKIGGKLFARIGIVALVLGAAFFLKYAFHLCSYF